MARARSPVDRLFGAVVPRAVGAVDPEDLLQRVDMDALVARIDVNALLARIDLDALLARVDLDAVLARTDLDAVLARVDIADLTARAGIDRVVADATAGVANRALDLARRKVLAVDAVLVRAVDRLVRRPLGRPPALEPVGPGRPAGPVARLLAFAVDSAVVSATFGLAVVTGGFLVELFTSRTVEPGDASGPLWGAAYLAWWFTYLWAAVGLLGRTAGKGLLGLRVVRVDGGPVGAVGAAARALALPLSCVLGLGLVPAVVGRERRALHDHLARTRAVLDWGDRAVALPAALASRLGPVRAA